MNFFFGLTNNIIEFFITSNFSKLINNIKYKLEFIYFEINLVCNFYCLSYVINSVEVYCEKEKNIKNLCFKYYNGIQS